MPAACREHTRPQYENIIGRKPEGTQQCAELSSTAPAVQRDLSVLRCSTTSGRQDFRWVLVRRIRVAQKRFRAWRKGGTGADLWKERRREEIGCSVPGMHSAPNPRRIHRKSVNETVARLLLAGATFLMALRGRSRTRSSCPTWTLQVQKDLEPGAMGDIPQLRWHRRSRKLPFILSFRSTGGQKERLNVRFVRHSHGIGDALVIFRYRADPTNEEEGVKCDGDEDRSVLRRMRIPKRRAPIHTAIQTPDYLETREMGLAIWSKLPPRLAHATDLIVGLAWISRLERIARTYTRDSVSSITCTKLRLGYLARNWFLAFVISLELNRLSIHVYIYMYIFFFILTNRSD